MEGAPEGTGCVIPMDPYLVELDRALRDANLRQISDAVHGSGHLVTCTDCRAKAWEGTHSTPLAAFCDPCWRWRQARGWEFDGRTKAQLEAAECAA